MKMFFILLFLISTALAFGQTNAVKQKGSYFKTNAGEYFERVIKPWKYQYIQTHPNDTSDNAKKVGQITFWRSEAIFDNVTKKYWKPDISYDVYLDSDSTYINSLSAKVRSLSNCDTINRGGDIVHAGHFMLFSASPCVNCASSSNIYYCRKIINHILESVPDKDTYDWNAIVKQFVIDKAKLKT